MVLQWLFDVAWWVLLLQVAYLSLFALASVLPRKKVAYPKSPQNVKLAILIPCYQEDHIILETTARAVTEAGPNHDVYVLADGLKTETHDHIRDLGGDFLEMVWEQSTKAKSMKKAATDLVDKGYTHVLILDADNIMEEGVIAELEKRLTQDSKVVQLHRGAKNKQTAMAYLDAVNEEIGNSIFRRGHRALGLSSALIGSAMVFTWDAYSQLMEELDPETSGEDKWLELKIFELRWKVEYWEDLWVYDEKVSSGSDFSKQRTRWVGSQFFYFSSNALKALGQGLRGNLDYFDKVLQWAVLPKTILMAVLVLFSLAEWLILGRFDIAQITIAYGVALLIAVPGRLYTWELFKAVAYLPIAIVYLILGILKINKKTATSFEVTQKKE